MSCLFRLSQDKSRYVRFALVMPSEIWFVQVMSCLSKLFQVSSCSLSIVQDIP
jgi:hypothetical protein